MKFALRNIPWLIILLPFGILAFCYGSIPDKVLIARSFFSDDAIIASKTLFTVFRVPLIEVVCAAAIEVVRRKFADSSADYYCMWSILLYTVALKSLLQAFEIVSPVEFADEFFYVTLGVVIVGIILALVKGWRFFPELLRSKQKFSGVETAILIFAFVAYLALAIVPLFVFK
jgi:hypothetical protein